MTAPDARQITNRTALSGRKVAGRMRILLVPVMLALVIDFVPWHASETLRRLIVALIKASGLAILCFAWRYRTMASRSSA